MTTAEKPSRRKRGKSKQRHKAAERAAEWFAREKMDCITTVRAVATQWQRQDLFAADCIGKRSDGSFVAIQVTAGDSSNASPRRRKLERVPWSITDTVLLLQLTSTPNPANRRKISWWFRVHSYREQGGQREWIVWDEAVPVPSQWLKAWKGDTDGPQAD